jgi:hypothetical protein
MEEGWQPREQGHGRSGWGATDGMNTLQIDGRPAPAAEALVLFRVRASVEAALGLAWIERRASRTR